MLTKLLKYEFKATGRAFLPLYGALLALALVNNLLLRLDGAQFMQTHELSRISAAVGVMAYVLLIMAIFVLTLVVMIQRFYKNLLSEEGYLMFTLPVRTWQLLTSKLIVSMVWILLSCAVTLLSIFLMALGHGFSLGDLARAWEIFCREVFWRLDLNVLSILLQAFLTGLVVLAEFILGIYASIAVGQLFPKHRYLAAFGAFLGFGVIDQILTLLLLTGGGLFVELTGLSISYMRFFNALFGLSTLYSLVWAAGYFLLTNYILSRRLNLE